MYYACFDLPGITDIFAFDARVKRDAWVYFMDPYSVEVNETPTDCVFRRKAINTPEELLYAKQLINQCNEYISADKFDYLNGFLSAIDKRRPLVVFDNNAGATVYLASAFVLMSDL